MNTPPQGLASLWIYLLPFLHLSGCILISVAQLVSGWQYLIVFDFPFSILIVGATWRFDYPLFWFGIFGTAWWYFLSLGARSLIRRIL